MPTPTWEDIVLAKIISENVWWILGAAMALGIFAQPKPAKRSDDGWGNW